jgi:hypothetical protein
LTRSERSRMCSLPSCPAARLGGEAKSLCAMRCQHETHATPSVGTPCCARRSQASATSPTASARSRSPGECVAVAGRRERLFRGAPIRAQTQAHWVLGGLSQALAAGRLLARTTERVEPFTFVHLYAGRGGYDLQSRDLDQSKGYYWGVNRVCRVASGRADLAR